LVEEGVGRTVSVGSNGLVVVLAVVVVAVWEAAAVVGWGECLWRSTVAAARNTEIVVVGFAVVVHTNHWHTPVAVVVDVTLDSPVFVAVTVPGYSFACCQWEYPSYLSQAPVPNCLLHHHHHHLLLLRLLASHHT
jgi:hypothetical protein